MEGSTAVAGRALAQLRADPRFLAISLVVPLVVIFLLSVFFDAVDTPAFNQSRYALPAAAFIIHFVTYVLTTIVLVRERVTGTLERMFISGYRPTDVVLGYLLAYTAVATVQSVVILVELNLLFDLGVGLVGLAAVFLVMWLLAVLSMALGLFISNFARNEGQVIPFIPMVMVPSIFLSGLAVSVDALPGWARALSRIVPLRYAVDALREVPSGGGLTGGPVVMLAVLILLALLLASRTLREQV